MKNLSLIFDELSVLVPLWLDWAFFSEVIDMILVSLFILQILQILSRRVPTERLPLGDWRVVYAVNKEKHIATVLLIAHRSKAYR